MAVVTDIELVRDAFVAWGDTDEGADFLYEVRYIDAGDVIPVTGLPGNWEVTMVDTSNAKMNYDSYGYGYINDGFVVFKVTDGVEEALYKLPVEYASFQGSDYHPREIAPVQKTEKTIYVWESK
jgi:hypothetical protein